MYKKRITHCVLYTYFFFFIYYFQMNTYQRAEFIGIFPQWKMHSMLKAPLKMVLRILREQKDMEHMSHLRARIFDLIEDIKPSITLPDEVIELHLAPYLSDATARLINLQYSQRVPIPKCLLTLKKLQTTHDLHEKLNLCAIVNGDDIGDEGCEYLSQALEQTTTVHTLDLSDNAISSKGIEALKAGLIYNTSIRSLDLRENRLGSKGARSIATLLEKNTTLQTLLISNINTHAGGGMYLTEALEKNITLLNLDIGWNPIFLKPLILMLAGSSLRMLNISGIKLTIDNAKLLATTLETNKTIHTLNLSHMSIDDEGAVLLANVIKVNTTIHTLDLSHNQIQTEGTTILAKAVKQNNTLQDLNMFAYTHKISALLDGGMWMDALKLNTSIHTIRLGDTSFKDDNVELLVDVLTINKTLHTLAIAYIKTNNVEMFKSFGEALKSNKTIHTLGLYVDQVEFAKQLGESLKKNKGIHTLNIRGDDGAVEYVANALKLNKTIHTFNVGYGYFSEAAIHSIVNMLKVNNSIHNVIINNSNMNKDVIDLLEAVRKADPRIREIL